MILLFFIYFLINSSGIIHIDSVWIFVFVILYFCIKLRNYFSSAKSDFFSVFSINSLKLIFTVVILNIFVSYGLLYISNYLLTVFPDLSVLSLANHSFVAGGLVATVLISPISEELIFRGVFLNRLELIVPTLFAILISSLLFASLHTFGNITSAFIFAICMALLYLKTDNIFVPIFAHFLNNVLAGGIVILDVNNVIFSNSVVIALISFLAIVSLLLIIFYIFKELNSIK